MCLSQVTTTYDKPSDLIEDGWKEFSGIGLALRFTNFANPVPQDEWIEAGKIKPPQDIAASDGKTYKAGFHIYADKPNSGFSRRRVYLRKITCVGVQDAVAVVIAQEMYVPSNQDAWPPLEQQPPVSPLKKLAKKMRGA